MASSPRVEELRKKFDENPRRYFAPLANEYRKAGDFAQAIAICREYLPQQPGHMSGHIVFGQALYEARQFDEAKTVFETALSLDPENLIALKHLGDIELIAGRTEAARAWYKKILDADPRNEEILAQLAKLEEKAKGGKVGATMVMQAVPRPGTSPKAPAPAKPEPAPPPPAPPAPPAPPPPSPVVSAESPTQEIRLDTIPMHAPPSPPAAVEPALGLEPTSMGGSVQPESLSTVPTIEIDTSTVPREAPAIDSFSLEGLETTSLTSEPPPAAAPPPPPPPAASAAEAPAEGLVDLDISIPAATPEPAAPEEAVAAPESVDLDFAAPPPATAAVQASPAPAGDDLPLIDMGAIETVPAPEPMPAAATSDVSAPVFEAAPAPVMDLAPSVEDHAPPVMDHAPVEDREAPADSSSAFVTETMADLYLKQGHRDEALRVYRALLEKRPGDPGLLARIASLQPPPPRTGPTIREMLHMIALRRPGYRPELPTNGNGGAAMAAPTALAPDALSPLFNQAPVSPQDEAAALALATVFVAQNGQEPVLEGAPAHPASSDLSLNSVFSAESATHAPPAAGSTFSFDQFFSQRATAEHGVQAVGEEAPESKEDVAQFSQWLEGLKQK